ncbi:MAG: RNA-binding S4 domain-containing protein [Candidatus Cloacimonetes bacterium]|nr:RNA-binding S4 domain-containing protein [Candidatus Cloacimonadota bacterium]
MKFYLDNTEDIFLYQLLKAAGLFEEYAHVRKVTNEGEIKVNDQTVFKQRTRIFPGDEVRYKDIHIKVIAGKSPPVGAKVKPEFVDHREGNAAYPRSRDAKPEFTPPREVREEQVQHGKPQRWQQKPLQKEKNLRDTLETEAVRLHAQFIRNGLTLSIAESCTGGMASEYITRQSGSSAYFLGGIISYSNTVKTSVLGVTDKILEKDGAVSDATALAMGKGVMNLMDSDIAGAITGIAGPEGAEPGKPVGTVHISVRTKELNYTRRYQMQGNRQEIRMKSSLQLFKMLHRLITGQEV